MFLGRLGRFLSYHLDSMAILLYYTFLPMLIYVLWKTPLSEADGAFLFFGVIAYAMGRHADKERLAFSQWGGASGFLFSLLLDIACAWWVYWISPTLCIAWRFLACLVFIAYGMRWAVRGYSDVLLPKSVKRIKREMGVPIRERGGVFVRYASFSIFRFSKGKHRWMFFPHRETIFSLLRTEAGQMFFLHELRQLSPMEKSIVRVELSCDENVGWETTEERELFAFAHRLAVFAVEEARDAGSPKALLPRAERRVARRVDVESPSAKIDQLDLGRMGEV